MQDGTKRKRPDESLSYEDFPVDPNTDFKSPQRTTGYESTDVNQTKDNIIAISWGGKLAPKVPTVPFEFECLDDYKTAFLDGISYELNYKINEVYKMYVAALFSASNKAPRCKAHGPAAFNVDKKGNYYYKCKQCNFYQPIQPDIITPSRRDVRSIATVINFMHVRNISYHESTLIRKNNVYTLYFSDDKLDNVEYSKDDLWVIFSDHISPIFVVSESYGVSQRNRLEITPFFNNRLIELPMQIKVTSIRLFNVQSEKLSISKLFSLDESSLPILPVLLNNNQQNVVTNDFLLNDKQIEEIRNIAEEISNEYHLNEYQKLSLMKVIDFFHPNTATPLLLIHGIFGAGKSKLLSIIIIFIDRILKLLHLDDQVLIASSTNVAVDNILNNLIEYEFEDFTRVGSVKKIKKNLLPYVTGHGNDEAISELHLIISETDNSERSVVQRALENAQNEYNQKKSKIDSVRVVGATCAATSFSVMSNKKFSFVILDECSQQTEPSPNGFRLLCCRHNTDVTRQSLTYAAVCFIREWSKNGVTEDDRRPVLETLPTMCLFDVKCGAEQYRGGSICNAAEAITVVNLVKYLVDAGISARDIGVIAFYKAQVELICEGLTVDGQRKRTIVDVSTVDAFQGDEREVVIITTAKTKKTAFVDSPERVNVAVSRARRHLFVVSNVRPLIESELWNTLFARACRAPNKRIALENAPDTGWRPF
ncbi:protein ZGRF1 isoform X1 [Histomonas meleagridis]|uniref:protein ZGRF1 isoform X1 n=1 Tax=Histomonas meleagridis TaxID=135588 RepID=UPI00355A7EB5|nr:protein ZGRF1 isoform X1 [Histomonas meleagridis]